jgi:hypothetical protein
MPAAVPHDVDLEDRLVFGLTPVRFGYLVIGVLAAVGLCRLHQLPVPVRLVPSLLFAALAAALAWGRWRGRPLDHLALDAAVFCRRNYGLRVAPDRTPPAVTLHFRAINALARRPPEAGGSRGREVSA